jgi:predicted regulator of Ras-like GTPase activity (Roadblock/LC7/MglB family)
MNNEVYTFALKNTLKGIKNVCPSVLHTFIFTENGEITACDSKNEKTMVQVVDAFNSILESADKIGGVKSITIEGSNGRIDLSHIKNIYLVTVASKNVDIGNLNTATRVLVPTILKLLDKICPAPLKNKPPLSSTKPETPATEEIEEEKMAKKELEEIAKPQIEPPVNQLIVENLGGFLVPSDTVRIDNAILSRWKELYENKEIETVEIETFDGKTIKCKVKPIKNSKYKNKGVIQMPKKAQTALEIKKGELVKVKPAIQ